MALSDDEILSLLTAGADLEQDPTNASKQWAFQILLDMVRQQSVLSGWQPPQVFNISSGDPLRTRLRVIKTAGVPISERFEVDGVSLVLYIKPHNDQFTLHGTIDLRNQQEAVEWIGAEVEIYSDNTVISTAHVDDELLFECQPWVSAGQIELRVFSLTQKVIVTEQIELS